MGTFVTGNAPLPARKVDARPPVTPEQEIDAADVNNLWDAASDLRSAVYSAATVVNVKDPQYAGGAKGDGTTDDTAALQAAATAAGGKTLYFPAGTYRITGTVNITTAGTTVIGDGAKVFVAFGVSLPANGTAFSVMVSDVTFDGLWFDSTGTSTSTTTNKYIIKFVGTTGTHLKNSTVRNCKFTNLNWADNLGLVVATHAVYASFADLTTVDSCTFDTIGGAAIFTTQLDGLKVLNNNINDTGWYSIQLQALVLNALIDGNRITGTRLAGRIWGGSINLMSNGAGTAGEGLGTNRRITVVNNYISGVHSYTGAVHIESSSHVIFARNKMENITLSPGSTFYPDGTPAVYISAYTRTFDQGGGVFIDEGSCDHIDISGNDLIATGTNPLGIRVDNQHKAGVSTVFDTLRICDNILHSPDASNVFDHCITVHGQQGGLKNVIIRGNKCSGSPTTATPTGGIIGVLAITGVPMTEVVITDNSVEYVGTPTTSTHTGISLGDFVQRVMCHSNTLRNCWNGIRILSANAGPVYLGPGNVFFGSASADYLFSAGPTVTVSTSPRYGFLTSGPRGSALAASNIVVTAAAGEYRVSVTARTTTSGTGTTATASLIWTDEGGVKTFTTATFALNAVDVTGQANATLIVHVAASTNIQVSVAGTFGTSLYSVSAIAEKLN
jgi:hypothetical protein